MKLRKRKTAGQLAHKAASDTTKYNALEVGYAMTDDVMEQIRICINNHNSIIDENEYCIVRVIAGDPLISNARRFKYYAWMYLPSPRPNQAVFLYNKTKNSIRRLWVLPSDAVMAELHELSHVNKRYQTMKIWTDAFYKTWKFIPYKGMGQHLTKGVIQTKYINFKGELTDSPGEFVNTDPTKFWEFIRHMHDIDMLSEHEYFLAHREELIKAGCKIPDSNFSDAFDFSKISVKQFVDSQDSIID
jgi:hypothetical protein